MTGKKTSENLKQNTCRGHVDKHRARELHDKNCAVPAYSLKNERGFSMVETLIALALSLIVLAGSIRALNDAMGLNDKSIQIADIGQNMRAGLNLLERDFMSAGWGIPTGGIPLPSGDGSTEVNRPGPPGTTYTFGAAMTLSAVNPGAALGPKWNGRATDMVNILYADNSLQLNQKPLDAIATDGSNATVNIATKILGVNNEIQVGDLIAFSNALGNTVQYVTKVSGQILYFNTGDPLNLNQPGASQGSISLLKSGGVYPPTTATRIWLVSYYLDFTTDPSTPRLIRRINDRDGEAVALVLENMQLSYDLVDGVSNPTNVKTPTAPNSPNQIRKVNILLSGRSTSEMKESGDYLRQSLTAQVSLRSLSFIDRYR